MDLLTRMVEHHVWLTGEILRCAARVTDAQLDEPIVINVDDDPDPSTLRRILSRLIGQMGMWNAAMADRPYDWSVEEHESLSSMRERLATRGRRTSRTSARWSRPVGSTTRSWTRSASPPRCSRTAA